MLRCSPWHIDEVPLAVVLPDLQPDLEHDVLLLVLRLRGPAGPVTLAAGLLERLREADEDLVDGLGHVAAEHVALDHVPPALAAARVAHRTGEGETRLFVGLSLAAGEKYYSVNPELSHTRPKRYTINIINHQITKSSSCLLFSCTLCWCPSGPHCRCSFSARRR